MRPEKRSPASLIGGPVLAGLLMLAIWYAVKVTWRIHDLILPAPHDVLTALFTEADSLIKAAGVTFIGASCGFIAAVGVGSLLSLLLAASSTMRHAFYPYVIFMQMVPILATAAIIVILFDVGLFSVALIAFLIGVFPIIANTLQGLQSVPERQCELFRLYKATPLQELLLLRIPYALPYFFTGAKIAATLAVIGSVTGEIFAGSSSGTGGLGFQIMMFKSELKTAAIYAATLLCCLMGYLFVLLVIGIRQRALGHWHESGRPFVE